MMSTPATTKTDLLLLGLLLDRPMHGYELYQQIQAEGIDDWFNVSAAGVYYSLGKMRDQGQVSESRIGGGRSSRKSVYRITEQGRSEFFDAMEGQLSSQEKCFLEYDLAIFLLNKIPRERAIAPMEEHQTYLVEQARQIQSSIAAQQDNGRSPNKLAILDHRFRFLEMELNWLADVIQGIRENGDGEAATGGAGRGLMILSGDLRDFHLPDLLRLIISGQHSGTLEVKDGAETRGLVFERGQPVCGFFEQRGMRSTVSPDEVIERLCDVFRRQEGQFTFDQRRVCRDGTIALDCSAEDLMLRGCRKVDSWDIIQRLVPSADTIFEPGTASRHLDRLSLTTTEGQIVARVDGVKDVTTIARELDLTLFETCRAFYCLSAAGVLRTADRDKIRLRRVFREIAELMCSSTLAWRTAPDDRACEEEVNERAGSLPIRLRDGRIEDRADPQLGMDELTDMYHSFLQKQFEVIGRRFGHSNARGSYARSLQQLAPELQGVAKRYNFGRIPKD
jgi:DNA-binding PadR family transcriptional regulator